MRWNTLFLGCIALLLTGRASSDCGLQPQVTVLGGGQIMQCDNKDGPFLRSLDFKVESGRVKLEESSSCLIHACCNKFLRPLGISNEGPRVDYEEYTKVGASIEGSWSCRDKKLGIANTTARCDSFETDESGEIDGSGWNFVEADKSGTLCTACQNGTYLEDNMCESCPRGTYTDGEGTSQCLYCPAGHTTYSYNPNTCVGPQLNLYSDKFEKNKVFAARVSYDTLGNLERKKDYWSSIGDWSLLKSGKKFGIIKQKFTFSYRLGHRPLVKRPVTTAVKPIIENVYCYKGKGEEYEGFATKTLSGEKCTGPSPHCVNGNSGRICYCKNKRADHGYTEPYCETASGASPSCGIPKCNDQDSNENVVTSCGYEKLDISEQIFGFHPIEFVNLERAQRICDKLGGECGGVWREGQGNGWRITTLSLPEKELGSGPFEFYRKSSDCVNPYHEFYFEQK